MAAITPTKRSTPAPGGFTIVEYYGTSGATQADTLTTPAVDAGGSQKLLSVAVPYDAAPTYTGTALTVKIDSALGSTYDVTLATGSDNGQTFVYNPAGDVRLLPGDAVVVGTPSAGGSVKSTISVRLLQG